MYCLNKIGIILLFLIFLISSCSKKQVTTQKNSSEQTKSQSYEVTFIELGSVKCTPCKMMQPIIEEIEKEYATQVKVVFYDVWTEEGRPYAQKYKITAIPTQVFLDADGNEFYRHTGFLPKSRIVSILNQKGIN